MGVRFDSGDGRRWVLLFDGGDGRQLWQWWKIETAFNGSGGGGVRWWQQGSTTFDGIGDGLRQEDERATQGKATQQPASTMRGRECGATRGRREMMARQPAGGTVTICRIRRIPASQCQFAASVEFLQIQGNAPQRVSVARELHSLHKC